MENKDTETIGLKGVIVGYLHQWKLFLAAFIFSFIPAILYLALYPRTYEFMARIQVQEESGIGPTLGLGEAAGLMKSFGLGSSLGGSVSIDDEKSILASSKMLGQMILDLGINVEYTKPYSFYKMYNEAPLKLTADSATFTGIDSDYKFTVSVSKRKVKVKVSNKLEDYSEKFVFTSLPARMNIDAKEFTLDFDNGASIDQDFKLDIICYPVNWVAEVFAEDFVIEEVSTSSNVIEISCADHVRERGKAMLNTLIQKYTDEAKTFKQREDEKVMSFVDDRLAGVISELKEVEIDIEAFKTKNEMTLLESDVLFYTEQMKELQMRIIELESSSHVIKMMDDYVKNPENKYSVIPPLLSAVDGEKGGAIILYNEAVLERDRLLKGSNENNPLFKIADAEVNKLRESIHLMIDNAEKSIQISLADLKDKEKLLFGKLKSVPAQEREYRSYSRQQEILQGVYLILLQKREETALSLGLQTDHAKVIDPAFIKKKPIGPRKLYAAIGMIFLTLLLPVGYLIGKGILQSIWEEYKRTK